jgi:ATP-dependent Lhr-like helicase
MESKSQVLTLFHPFIERWFVKKYGFPTDVQAKSWPLIAEGKHVLISAPTGSGKTFAAFMWALNQLVSGTWPCGATRVLYVSPLKALNNDIKENLITPLEEIKRYFKEEGIAFPAIRIMTRSGDTPPGERQRMIRNPPEILITTPESLNLILSSRKACSILSTLDTVIIDEVHAVISEKRGTHLMTAVDRLVRTSGEFHRIALSATVKPLEMVAEFVGGYVLEAEGRKPEYRKRPVTIVQADDAKEFHVRVRFPTRVSGDGALWPLLVREFSEIIKRNRSTLFFTNARRLAEKIAWMINDIGGKELAYSHHGSLSKEIRSVVERKLREGQLSAIIATSSLELGIDIGALDEVVLIQAPPSVVSGIQRIGRAGHSVGQVSKGIIFPTHGRDFIDSAVCAKSIMEREIEEARPVQCPLDVLAQVIVSMTGIEKWTVEGLFNFIRTSSPYHKLTRHQFDLVLEMLAGRYSETRIRELHPRISYDRIDNTVQGKEGVLNLIYHSGGTIPDRGYYGLLLKDSSARIGELDEEFVWERKIGDTFSLGAQSWQITKIDSQNVEVTPCEGPVGLAPFWKADKGYRGFHLFEKIGKFLGYANDRLSDPSFLHELIDTYFMEEAAAIQLIDFLKSQKEVTGCNLPHRHHVLIEHFSDPLSTKAPKQVIVYTMWGGRVNKPFSLALSAAWEEHFGFTVEIFSDDDALLLMLPHDFDLFELLKLVRPDNGEALLRKKLEATGFFGARFRENAGRALLLPRGHFRKRMPLWLNRLRSKKLFNAVAKYQDFPVTLETWRQCLNDDFDMENLGMLLDELITGKISTTEINTKAPSPFSRGLIWWQINTYMYADDTLHTARASSISEDLLREVALSSHLRPELVPEQVLKFQEKLHRLSSGYSPQTPVDLLDWVKERLLIPESEWNSLLMAVEKNNGISGKDVCEPVSDRIVRIKLPGTEIFSITAVESLPRILQAIGTGIKDVEVAHIPHCRAVRSLDELQSTVQRIENNQNVENEIHGMDLLGDLIMEWLYSYGPVEISYIEKVFGIDKERLGEILADLSGNDTVVIGRLVKDAAKPQICDSQNMESLLRISRAASRPSFKALDVQYLPLFMAQIQGLTEPGYSPDDLRTILDQLFGYPAPYGLWESDILPARLSNYSTSWLDMLFAQSELMWFGCSRQRVAFCFSSDYELFSANGGGEDTEDIDKLFPAKRGKYSFWDILDHSRLSDSKLTGLLWKSVWQGRVFNDSWNSLRDPGFGVSEPYSRRRSGRRIRTDRWKAGRESAGNWYLYQIPDFKTNPLEELELSKERVRQLLSRYGVLFRDLLENELPLLRWTRIFRTLRIMELSGEIIGGHFFQGIRGLQFISSQAFRMLQKGLPEDCVYWMNACDPAALCGIKLEGLSQLLPARISTNHVVYHGTKLVLVSRGRGRELEISVPPEDPNLPQYLALFKIFVNREFHPESRVKVEKINGTPVHESLYQEALTKVGFRKGYRYYTLERDI